MPHAPLLFRDDVLRCGGWRGGRGRDHKCQPGIPAGRSIHVAKFPIGFEVDVTLEALTQRNDVAELRTDAEYLRLETSDMVARAAVATEFFVGVACQTNLNLLGQELRRAPI